MIESVAVRQRGAFDFITHYDNLCALQNSFPLPAVKAHITDGVLDVNGDRVRATDWVPMLNTLRINRTLNFAAIRSYYQQTIDEGKCGMRRKTPAIRSKEITYRLCKAFRECLSVTPVLSTIELQGLPLRERDLATLSKGLAKNGTLQHLSLEYSSVGDDGLEIVCQGVKNSPSIITLNFTGCGLSWKGSESLGGLVKHQAMRRHNEAWQDSLRYRRPDLDRMPGIRRITINANPMLGDQGATALAEALKDDLWLKALDLQQCGISNQGAKALLDVLKYNTTIIVLDVRQNPLIDQDVTRSIMEQVMINSNGEETEYKWIKSTTPREPTKTKPRKKRTKTLQSSFGKKTIIKVTSGNGRRRTKSAGSVSRPLAPFNSESIKPGPGLPWRTAMRANRYRGYPPEHTPGQSSLYESLSGTSSPTSSPVQQDGPSIHIDYGDSTTDDQSINDSVSDTVHATRGTLASRSLDFADATLHGTSAKQLKIENEGLKRRLKEEINARTSAEEKVLELTIENRRIQQELEDLNVRRGLLDDDQVLESIESTFQQFHAFLDLLRDAGLGQLISMAGLDQTPIPLDGSESFLSRTGPSRANHSRRHDTSQGQGSKHLVEGDSQMSLSESKLNSTWDQSRMDHSFRRHILPENYGLNYDPTMRQLAEESIQDLHMTSKFDELYEKVLNETEGALSKARNQSFIKGGPAGDTIPEEKDHSMNSQHSNHSQKSHHSQVSQKSQTSQHSVPSQHSLSSHRSQQSNQGQVSHRVDPSPSASQHSQASQSSHKSLASQKSQKSQPLSQKSEHSIASVNHTNGLSNGLLNLSKKKSGSSAESDGSGHKPPLTKQRSHERSNGNYSMPFEKSNSDISENIEELLEDPDQDF